MYIGSAVALIEVADGYVGIAEADVVKDAVGCNAGSAFDLWIPVDAGCYITATVVWRIV